MTPTDLVYIVEDDSIACYVIQMELKRHDKFQNNKTFKNGKEALDLLMTNLDQEELLPDLILLDVNMPIMDGWEFLEAFSKLKYAKKISVIILTSSINPEDREKSKQFDEVKGFMSKPLSAEKLDEILLLIRRVV